MNCYLYRFEQMLDDYALALSFAAAGSTPLGTRRVWLATNSETEVAFSAAPIGTPGVVTALPEGEAYEPTEGITHSEIRHNGEDGSNTTDITLPLYHPVSQLYAEGVTDAPVYVIIAQLSGAGLRHVFTGVATNPSTDGLVRKLKCSALTELLKAPSNTRTYGALCGHTLYDPYGCRVSPAKLASGYFAYREDGYLDAAVSRTATTLVVPEAANRVDGFFNNGFVLIEPLYDEIGSEHVPRPGSATLMPVPVGGVRRSIHKHVGATLTLDSFLMKAFPEGARVSVFAGCDQTRATCQARFGNFIRGFGGFPYYNGKNPFESGLKV